MFNRIRDITGQYERPRRDLGDSQQVFTIEDVIVKPVIQIHMLITPAPLYPLRCAKDLRESLQVRANLRMFGKDVSPTVRLQIELMTEHILKNRHYLPYTIPSTNEQGEENPEVGVGEVTHALKRGSSLYFDASIPHTLKNTGARIAKCLSVITPPVL